MIALAFWLWQESTPQHSGLVDLLLRASPTAKFVLLILLVFSIFSWAIILTKARMMNRTQRQSSEFLQVFSRSTRLQDLYAASASFRASPLAAIYIAAYDELRAQASRSAPAPNLEAVTRVMQSTAITETTKLERSLGWLASTASTSPFIGLFGTVIGIIIAFEGLSQASTA